MSSTGLVGGTSHTKDYRPVASGPSEMQEMEFQALELGAKGGQRKILHASEIETGGVVLRGYMAS